MKIVFYKNIFKIKIEIKLIFLNLYNFINRIYFICKDHYNFFNINFKTLLLEYSQCILQQEQHLFFNHFNSYNEFQVKLLVLLGVYIQA